MASRKTECSELSVAFGLSEIDPLSCSSAEASFILEGRVSPQTLQRFLDEFRRNTKLYGRLFALGQRLRSAYLPLRQITAIQWLGGRQQAASVSSSQDLLVNNIAISIKVNSNVVINRSPHNLFEALPTGQFIEKKSENWFLRCAPDEMYRLYSVIQSADPLFLLPNLPATLDEFERQASREERRQLASALESALRFDDFRVHFEDAYGLMCRRTSEVSAELWNKNISSSFGERGRKRAVSERLIQDFFRLNSLPYILTGLDGGNLFAVVLPTVTEFRRNWEVKSVSARARKALQSVVQFEVNCFSKGQNQEYPLSFRAEVRWSHGKFCGNPEAKLYKEFAWSEVPFFTVLDLEK